MRILFLLLCSVCMALGQGTPNFVKNPWSTNVPPNPVLGNNNLSVSNRIVGGNGSNWLFYGIGPRTVATLGELSSSQLWTNDAGLIRNINESAGFLFSIQTNPAITIDRTNGYWTQSNSISADHNGGGDVGVYFHTTAQATNAGGSFFAWEFDSITDASSDANVADANGLNVNLVSSVPSSTRAIYAANSAFGGIYFVSPRTPAIAGQGVGAYGSAGAYLRGYGVVGEAHGNIAGQIAVGIAGTASSIGSTNSIGGYLETRTSSDFLTDPNLTDSPSVLLLDSRSTQTPLITARTNNGTTVFKVDYDGSVFANNQTNSGTLDVTGKLTTYDGINDLGGLTENVVSTFLTGVKFPSMTAGKLASYVNIGGGTYLSNSIYSDSDIANALAGLASTNIYILTNKGTGYFTQLYSPTNTASASNQVVATFQGLPGQTNDLARFQSNGTTVVTIKPSGFVGIGTNVPATTLDVVGTAHISGGMTNDAFIKSLGGISAVSSIQSQSLLAFGNNTTVKSYINANNDGQMTLNNNAGNATVYIAFNGITAAFPAIARTNGDLLVIGGNGSFAAGNTNRLIVEGGIGVGLAYPPPGMYSQKTNSAFVAPIAGQIIYCTSNYDVYIITPTKTNLFAVGQ